MEWRAVQLAHVLRHLPVIYATALLNMLIVLTLCVRENLSLSVYGWMIPFIIAATARWVQWIVRARKGNQIDQQHKVLRNAAMMSAGGISALGLWAAFAFLSGYFTNSTFVPTSLAFGASCVAHCLAPVRRAALGALLGGIVPPALAMLSTGNFDAVMLSVSMLSITLLMLRFVLDQHGQMVDSLSLTRQVRHQAMSDPLTDLENRRAMMEALDDAIDYARARGRHFGLALIDLDGFKAVNDTLGHLAGDALLVEVARRLETARQPVDRFGRLGGDEFLLILADCDTEAALRARTTAILAALIGPVEIAGQRVAIAASLGEALFDRDGADAETLLAAADAAMYQAKAAGREAGDGVSRSQAA